MGKTGGVDYHKPIQTAKLKVWSLRSGWTLVGIEVVLWRRAEAQEQTVRPKDLLGHPGRDSSPAGVKLGDMALPLWGQKRQWVALRCPVQLAQAPETQVRAANPDTGFLLCFSLSSKTLCVSASALLRQISTSHTARVDFPPEDQWRSVLHQATKIWNFETQQRAWDKTQEHYTSGGEDDSEKVKPGIWESLGQTRGNCLLFSEDFLPSLGMREPAGTILSPTISTEGCQLQQSSQRGGLSSSHQAPLPRLYRYFWTRESVPERQSSSGPLPEKTSTHTHTPLPPHTKSTDHRVL